MFRERLLTSLVLIPLVLLGIFYGNIWILSAIVLLLMLGMGFEWLSLIPLTDLTHRIVFMLGLLICLIPSLYWLDHYLLINFVVWSGILLAILTFPASQAYWGNRFVVAGVCLFVLTTFLSSLYALLHIRAGRDLLVYLLFLVWAADIGAYLVGKQWGRHSLIPAVSPGKTIEGVLGGVILTQLIAIGGYFYFQVKAPIYWFMGSLLIVCISIVGDLLISMLKRRCHLKDTGQLLPGHGGILDRLDSLIAALPFFYFFAFNMRFLGQVL